MNDSIRWVSVFEGYGPVGENRQTDLGGRPVDTARHSPVGAEDRDSPASLLHPSARENDFIDNLCRQMLAYGLGRTLQLRMRRRSRDANEARRGWLPI